MDNHPKIGFLTSGAGGNPSGIGQYANALNAANIPAVIFCNDGMVGISDALATGGDHVLLYRIVKDGTEQWSVPDYNLLPKEAAAKHWNKLKPQFHPDFVANKGKAWLQPINEINKDKSEWLGNFAVEFATIANWEGYKVAMFAWSSGEPEPEHWRLPGMVNYLKYCAAHKEMAAVALHEYDYGQAGMSNVYPWHIGRFQELYKACDEMGIKRPYVLISEFGWSYDSIPAISRCLEDVAFAAELYAKYPDVLGAVIWYLGPGFNNIANAAQQLITHITDFTLNTTFPDTEEPPMTTWEEELWKLGEQKKVLGFKTGAALQVQITADGYQALSNEFTYTRPDGKELVGQRAKHATAGTFRTYYCIKPDYNTVYAVEEDAGGTPMPTPFSGYDSPVGTAAERATAKIYPGSWFNANGFANRYQFPDGSWHIHTGNDANNNSPVWDSDNNAPVYAVADGVVTYAQLVIKSNGQPSTWGKLVVIEHPDGMFSRYGHLRTMTVTVGQVVKKGQQIGTVGGDEYGMPNHLHVDVSQSGILKSNPTYWPGDNMTAVQQNFVDPRKWIEEHRGGVVDPPTPPAGIEMAPYFLPAAGTYGDICILKNNWGQGDERQQLQRDGALSYVTKNQQWERRLIANDGVYLELDTSPGNNQYYTIDGTAWLPLKWNPGQEHTRTETVSFFSKGNCQPAAAPYTVVNKIRFNKLYPSWTSAGNITLANVIELQWIIAGQVEETYHFAPGKGLVAWENRAGKKSWVTEVVPVGQQGNNTREIIGCL
jgi:murein DD-endopeptidase MepM/ murein hydrolase activator NlpD